MECGHGVVIHYEIFGSVSNPLVGVVLELRSLSIVIKAMLETCVRSVVEVVICEFGTKTNFAVSCGYT